MKKTIKIFLFTVSVIITFVSAFLIYFYLITFNTKIDYQKLIDINNSIEVYDDLGNKIEEYNASKTITKYENIPSNLTNAFIAIEDKRFYEHNGIDIKGLIRATFNNIKSLKAKEGASTITQQLIKNTQLNSEKTINRKLKEIKLSLELEKKYSKDEILEKYLNTIYFGHGQYGITDASKFYFNKNVDELNLNDCAILASIIKAPQIYSPIQNNEKCTKRKNLVLKEMKNQCLITNEEYIDNTKRKIELAPINNINSYNQIISEELNNKINPFVYKNKKIKIYTSLNFEIQKNIEKEFNELSQDIKKSIILLDKSNNIRAYISNTKEEKRQLGSTIKPLLVFAPAIEENIVYSCTKIDDSKIEYGDYKPSNYHNFYRGKISVKDGLKYSSNIVAVKLLNETGIEKSKNYINKTNIKLTEKDNNLAIALGGTTNGYTLKEITSSYQVFNNEGKYNNPQTIQLITDENGSILYQNKSKQERIFSEETITILNDMMKDTATYGTAKKLKNLNFPIYSKTGTVGNEKYNTDAYSISYTDNYILGVWFGNKDNNVLDNSITGGGEPTQLAYNIWNSIYNNTIPNEISISKKVKKLDIDKITYEETGDVLLAEKNAPSRYIEHFLFKENNCPTQYSNIFSSPTIKQPKITVNNNGICISLCLPKYIDVLIFREENGIKKEVYDSNNRNKTSFIDSEINYFSEYKYSVIPYTKTNSIITYGKEIFLPKVQLDFDNML